MIAVGRRKCVLKHKGPVGVFASGLRAARIEADEPSYRRMAEVTGCSHNSLSEADRGAKLPTWKSTRAYLRACSVPDKEISSVWHPRWKTAKRDARLADEAQHNGRRRP